MKTHLSELHWQVELVQSHSCFAFGGGNPRGEKGTKDKGLDQDESFITSVLLAFNRTSTEEVVETTEMANGSCKQYSYLCPKHAVRLPSVRGYHLLDICSVAAAMLSTFLLIISFNAHNSPVM